MKPTVNKINIISFTVLVLCFSFCLQPGFLKAQTGTSLKVNKVLLLSATTDNTAAQWTVPAGMVWKITMIGANDNTACDYLIYINSVRAFYYCGYYNSSSYAGPGFRYSYSPGDLWLPQNTTVGTQCVGSPTAYRWLSVTEYKVMP
jgi:hypothetical protein